jgi:hypothetical protein
VCWKDGFRALYVILKYGLFERARQVTPGSPSDFREQDRCVVKLKYREEDPFFGQT